MTREELMVHAAKKGIAQIASHATLYKGTIDEIEVYEPDDMIDMFKLGAKWSDENPKEDIAELKKTIKVLKERLQFEVENKHKHFDNYLDR